MFLVDYSIPVRELRGVNGDTCRMLESSYNLLFGKLAMKCLFEDYFEEAMRFRAKIMLKPVDDANVDLIASVSFFTLLILLLYSNRLLFFYESIRIVLLFTSAV